MDSKPSVEIVIPVHNRRDTTLQALRSLSRVESDNFTFHIIIVDDGSTDGTAEAVRKQFPDVQIVGGDGTLHYAAGTNRGILEALKLKADFVLVANDDSIFHPEFLERLISTANKNPRSVLGAMLLLWDRPDRVFQVDFRWQTIRGGWQQKDLRSVFDLPREAFKVEGLAGNCVLISSAAIKECGLMDERKFPHGWGDIQYFVRMRKAGWKLLIEPRAYVWCEPNTNLPPLHTLSARKALTILLKDRRHPLNLQRQFIARWESAPSKAQAAAAFTLYVLRLGGKALNHFGKKPIDEVVAP